MKKLLSGVLAFALILSCTLLVGCSGPIYGKKFTYQGKVGYSWGSLDPSYGKKITDIITNQIKDGNVDLTKVKFGSKTVDISGENFTKGKQIINYFIDRYNEVAIEKLKDIEVVIGSKEEMTLTAKKGEETFVYNLKTNENSQGALNGYIVVDGVEGENAELTVYEEMRDNNIRIIGADYTAQLIIPVNNPLKNNNGEDVNEIEIDLYAFYTKA